MAPVCKFFGIEKYPVSNETCGIFGTCCGCEPSAQDLEAQRRYILGELSLDDLLSSAREFAQAAAQQQPAGR